MRIEKEIAKKIYTKPLNRETESSSPDFTLNEVPIK